jgi:hypothetical protein
MRTLYLRNVPDEVVERLDRLAARAGLPVSVFAVRELAEASRRADNATLLDSLPDLDVPTKVILAALAAERALGRPGKPGPFPVRDKTAIVRLGGDFNVKAV